jgi:DNA-binding SARP family transcriptional activator
LLLVLLANPRKLVLTDNLIGELWPDGAPSRVENALQAHVSRLRQRLMSLEPEHGQRRLVSHPSGYQLLVDDTDLDSEVFTRELERIAALADTDPVAAAAQLRTALALWRGPVLGGHVGGPLCAAAVVRYEESYLAALELLFDCELSVGNHAKIVPDLRDLLSRYPFQERFWQQLMIALYRCGRQGDALKAYRQLWHRLSDELGLEPTPVMREYERAILAQDPVLDLPVLAQCDAPSR